MNTSFYPFVGSTPHYFGDEENELLNSHSATEVDTSLKGG